MGRYRRRPRPPLVYHFFGVIPTSADLPRLAEAVLEAWRADTHVSSWGNVSIRGGNAADLDAIPAVSGVQPFSGILYDSEGGAIADLERLAAALQKRNVPYRLELCSSDLDDIAAYEHAWRDEWLL